MEARNTTPWPVNEVILWTLICRGLGTTEIAERYDVSVREVTALRLQLNV